MDKKKKVITACILLFFGFVVFPFGSFSYIKSGYKAEKVDLPGVATVQCREAGNYILWYDYQEGQTLEAINGQFELLMIRKQDSMTMSPRVNTNAFAVKREDGNSVEFASVSIEKVGDYELTLKDVKGEGSFSFGQSRSLSVMVALGIGLLGCVFSVVAALVILAVAYVPAFQNKVNN